MVLYSEKSTVRLDGKTAIVTGCNTGIGKETAKDFYKRGAYVIMACRNTDKAEEAAKDIINACKDAQNVGRVGVIELDLSSLQSIRECSTKLLEEHERIDLLINNAGIMACPYGKTKDGFEMQFGTNHLGHFLFTLLLLPRIIKSKPARIVTVSSMLHFGNIDFNDLNWEKRSYSAEGAYRLSKLANILFTKELNRRLKGANIQGVTVYSLHPGAVATDLQRHVNTRYSKGASWMINLRKYIFKSPIEGAQTTLYCALDESAGKESGLYYADCKQKKPCYKTENMEIAKKLWNVSSTLVGLEEYDPFK